MKVAFWIELKNIEGINLENLENGNPGIGGTEYMFLTLISELEKKKELEVFLFSDNTSNIPEKINSVYTESFNSVIKYYNELNIDILIMRTSSDEAIYELISKNKIKTILWAHNFLPSYKIKKIIENESFIKKYICVSKVQFEELKNETISGKSDFIYNFLDFKNYKCTDNILNNNNNVVYIGSLIKGKGADILIKNWKYVLREVEDAKLHIIGGGNLYDRKVKLGERNLAEKTFEEKIFKEIEENNLSKSIIFHGSMGMEKLNIMQQAKVGICNPSGKTETFGITALEFQAMGIPVVAKRCIGYRDTVGNEISGVLINNEKELVYEICKLLKNKDYLIKLSKGGREFVEEKFKKDKIITKWINIFEEVENMEEKIILEKKVGKISLLLIIKDILKKVRNDVFG